MQGLNDRLSSYMGEIYSLKQENAQLRKVINDWQENNSLFILPTDQSQHSRDIQELQNQISSIINENTKIVLQIDNCKLASDDFKNKYEIEHNLRTNVQADVTALHHTLKGFKEDICKLESEVESLEYELLRMRRDNEQENNFLSTQLGLRVSVEVEAAKSKDLTRALLDFQEQYENLIESNQREAESLFLKVLLTVG
ncbi:keratin, type I cuticular Ha5-like [Bufo gargarizans]|uniref:keratin, type I cuticular Ha5-like n=1 Tax=Bufo gargarizans TaxID=30331 RepID=UPI001CF35275|nr:keratin, type I cuticular Ha5-like [Bufo gargarizans]